MASLAMVVALMFLVALLIGPLCYLLSMIRIIPNWMIWILGMLTMFIGAYWFILPVGIVRFVGLFDILLGFLSIRKRNTNANISGNNS